MEIQPRKPKLVIFNGPPRSGKDTYADTLTELLGIGRPLKFARPLKEAAHALLGIPRPYDAFEETKDIKNSRFHNQTPREFYIWLSEQAVKPNHPLGKHFFGHSAKQQIEDNQNPLHTYVFSDGGFIAELEVLTEYFEDILVLHMHRDGCNFDNDSRTYVNHPDVTTLNVQNNGSLDDIPLWLIENVYPWLGDAVVQQAAIPEL